MKIDTSILKNEEKVIFNLRSIYKQYGYSCFKMSKFEEYDLYGQNKEFLVSDSVITFTDTSGKLMALKPDVTLSIVKQTKDIPGKVDRYYYNENVYRISEKTHVYKEIMQTGLECIGDVGKYNICEVLRLAAMSLASISGDSILNISHLGVVSAIIPEINTQDTQLLLGCIEEKNPHGIKEACERLGIGSSDTEFLVSLTTAYGDAKEVISSLRNRTTNEKILVALYEIENIVDMLSDISDIKINVDFSIINDIGYYNGLVFRGYVKGVPQRVLSGGQYDKLMAKMGKRSRAVGFAVYLDMLERMDNDDAEYDTDVLLLYSVSDKPQDVMKKVSELTSMGRTVRAEMQIPEKLTYREIMEIGKEGN